MLSGSENYPIDSVLIQAQKPSCRSYTDTFSRMVDNCTDSVRGNVHAEQRRYRVFWRNVCRTYGSIRGLVVCPCHTCHVQRCCRGCEVRDLYIYDWGNSCVQNCSFVASWLSLISIRGQQYCSANCLSTIWGHYQSFNAIVNSAMDLSWTRDPFRSHHRCQCGT